MSLTAFSFSLYYNCHVYVSDASTLSWLNVTIASSIHPGHLVYIRMCLTDWHAARWCLLGTMIMSLPLWLPYGCAGTSHICLSSNCACRAMGTLKLDTQCCLEDNRSCVHLLFQFHSKLSTLTSWCPPFLLTCTHIHTHTHRHHTPHTIHPHCCPPRVVPTKEK